METLIRFGNERQDEKKSGKVKKWKTRGIERSLKKKFNVSEVLEKKRLANIATDRASSM